MDIFSRSSLVKINDPLNHMPENVVTLPTQNNTIVWPTTFCGTSVNLYLDVATDTISEKCMFVPPKHSKKNLGNPRNQLH